MKMAFGKISAALLLLFIIAGCSSQVPQSEPQPSADNLATLDEITRLSSLAARETLAPADFEQLEIMLETENSEALEEVEELRMLAGFKEYMHAGHGLAFLYDYVRTGKHSLCPGHGLAHYYVFKKYGVDDKAEHGLEEAKEQMEEWEPKARAYDAEFPGPIPFETILSTIETHIERIDSGQTTATEEEVNFLANEASLCVEGDEEEKDHEEEEEHSEED